jgi:hypothetical protein
MKNLLFVFVTVAFVRCIVSDSSCFTAGQCYETYFMNEKRYVIDNFGDPTVMNKKYFVAEIIIPE